MGCGTYSPKRVKTGSEDKFLSVAGANVKPRKLNFELFEINRTPHTALGISRSEIERCVGLRK